MRRNNSFLPYRLVALDTRAYQTCVYHQNMVKDGILDKQNALP